jgi:hypothetical protein
MTSPNPDDYDIILCNKTDAWANFYSVINIKVGPDVITIVIIKVDKPPPSEQLRAVLYFTKRGIPNLRNA